VFIVGMVPLSAAGTRLGVGAGYCRRSLGGADGIMPIDVRLSMQEDCLLSSRISPLPPRVSEPQLAPRPLVDGADPSREPRLTTQTQACPAQRYRYR
jgi:hypothetical protein